MELINGIREPYVQALRNLPQDSRVLQHKVWETLAYRRLAMYRKFSGDTKLQSLMSYNMTNKTSGNIKKKVNPKRTQHIYIMYKNKFNFKFYLF
jgi:hypothetical protein